MVRGSGSGKSQASVKPQASKKAATSAKGSTTPSTSTQSKISGKITQLGQIPSCSTCGAVITEDSKALQCDCCQGASTWKCVDCLSITDDMYDRLVSDSGHCLKWFCDQCESAVMNKVSSTESQNGKFDQLIRVIEKLMERYDSVESRLADKSDSVDMVKLEARIQAIEDKLSRIEIGLDHRVTRLDTAVEDRLCALESRLSAPSMVPEKFNDHGIADDELIKCAVQEEVKRKTDEDKDLEARKNNVIMFRIPEKRTDDVQQRRDSDVTFVKDLLDGVFDMKIIDSDISHMYRLGRWDETKPRPLLVSFRSFEQKENLMANLRNLKQPVEKFRGISICHDLLPRERQERKRLIEEAKLEHAGKCDVSDDVGNYKFFVVGRGTRQRVIKVKKQSSSA